MTNFCSIKSPPKVNNESEFELNNFQYYTRIYLNQVQDRDNAKGSFYPKSRILHSSRVYIKSNQLYLYHS